MNKSTTKSAVLQYERYEKVQSLTKHGNAIDDRKGLTTPIALTDDKGWRIKELCLQTMQCIEKDAVDRTKRRIEQLEDRVALTAH